MLNISSCAMTGYESALNITDEEIIENEMLMLRPCGGRREE